MADRMYRSEHDRMIAGVCGGLADHLGVDPTLVRLAFVLLAFLHGVGILIYLAMAVIVPRESAVEMAPREVVRSNAREYGDEARRAVAGVRGGGGGKGEEAPVCDEPAPPAEDPGRGGGAPGEPTVEVVPPAPPPPPAPRPVGGTGHGSVLGAVLIALGVLLLARNLGFIWWIDWGVYWPVVLVLLGGALVARGLRR